LVLYQELVSVDKNLISQDAIPLGWNLYFKRNKKYDRITCKVYVEWKSYDDNDKIIVEKLCDEITLSDPFKYETMSIAAPFSLKREDYIKLMQFCFAKGVYESYLIKNNPYLSTDSIANFVNTLKSNLKDKD